MSNQFITIERDQPFVIPVQEWLAEDHLARFVITIVSDLDVSILEASYSGGGSAPYPPKMMLALLLALCEIQWVIKFQLSTKEINHIDEVINVAVASGSTFSQLNLTIDAFKNAVSNA